MIISSALVLIPATVATVTIAFATSTKGSGDLRFIDIIHKMGIEDIQPFPINIYNYKSLENWIYDLEEQLE